MQDNNLNTIFLKSHLLEGNWREGLGAVSTIIVQSNQYLVVVILHQMLYIICNMSMPTHVCPITHLLLKTPIRTGLNPAGDRMTFPG